MPAPRPFPPLKESDVRRLSSATMFKKGSRLLDADCVHNPMVSLSEPALFARVQDGQHRLCEVMVKHQAGDEFSAQCDCHQDRICSHVVATLLAWVHQDYAFTRVEQTPAEHDGQGDIQQWLTYFKGSSLAQLRALARRHQFQPKDGDRASFELELAARLLDPQAQQAAIAQLDEASQRVLQMLFLLSDGQPDTLAEDVQLALGWLEASDVELALRELSEWGLVVSVPSQWHRSNPYTLAPQVAGHMPQLSQSLAAASHHAFDRPRNTLVKPFAGDAQTLTHVRAERSLLEMLLLARHLPLHTRPAQTELAQARALKILRHWPYQIEELVQLQVKSGWLHQPESVLSVPPPDRYHTDDSLHSLRELTADDELSDLVGHILDNERHAPQTLHEVFARWQTLHTWTELWSVLRDAREQTLTVKRAVLGPPLSYEEWLQQLARGRRFITRVLMLLPAEQWHDIESLLTFVHAIHPDFLRERQPAPSMQVSWWFELNRQKVDPHTFEAWRTSYGSFIEHLLCGPLQCLGAVELALDIGDSDMPLRAFRVTPIGDALLQSHPLPPSSAHSDRLELHADMRATVPIGQHDIGVYTTLEKLAHFEKLAHGRAHYHFDVFHAHAAFEAGLNADDVLAQLASLAGAPVPDAVAAQWRDWWSRYALVRWYDGLTVIEFTDDYLLQELLTQTDLNEHVLFTFGSRLIAVRPDSADAIARQLVKKGYTPKVE